PRERPAPSRQRDLGARLPEPFCITAWGRLVLRDGQCPMGPLQSCRRLPACLSCGQLRSAQDSARARPRGGHRHHVAPRCPRVRTAPRRAVILAVLAPAKRWTSRAEFPLRSSPIDKRNDLISTVVLEIG